MTRTYANWESDARNTTKSVTQLGNELRDHWDDWKQDSPYPSWEDCILAELGMTADALIMRNVRNRKKAQLSTTQRGSEVAKPPARRINQQRTTAEERDRRRAIVGRLWDDGYAYESVRTALGISPGALTEDLKTLGLTEKRNPLGVMSIPIPTDRDLRWKEEDIPKTTNTEPEPTPLVSKTLRVPAGACAIASADQRIASVRQTLDDLLGGDIYALSLRDRNRLLTILQEAIERLTNNDQATPKAVRRTG